MLMTRNNTQPRCIVIADRWTVYDNSGAEPQLQEQGP